MPERGGKTNGKLDRDVRYRTRPGLDKKIVRYPLFVVRSFKPGCY